jgi:ATP-binding cassette subfamily B protein
MGAVINGPIERREVEGILAGAAGYGLLMAVTNWLFHYRYLHALAFGEEVVHDLRARLFRHVVSMPMAYFDTVKVGRVIGRLTSDVDGIRGGVQDVVFISAVQVGQMLVLLMAPVVWWANNRFSGRIVDAQRRASERFSRITATLAETVAGLRETRAFVREEENARFFSQLARDQAAFNVEAARTSAKFLPFLDFITQGFTAILLFVGGWLVAGSGEVSKVGDVIRFLLLTGMFFEPIRSLGNQYNAALAAMVGAERVFRLLDTVPAWEDGVGARDFVAHEDHGVELEFRDVDFAYEVGKPVLEGVNFVAEPGWTVALVGETGSGKTTVTALAAKFYLAGSGEVLVDGQDVVGLRSESYRSHLAIVPQQCWLFSGTVLDNIRFARPEVAEEQVVAVLERLGVRDLLEGLPAGLQTEVGEGGRNVSAGQRQVIGFARALLAGPRLLILDEATSAVDAVMERRIQDALPGLLEGRTSLVVAHRLSTIRRADLILVMGRGRVLERGTHAELLAAGGMYAELWRRGVDDGGL